MKNILLTISLILSICFAQTTGGAGSANEVKVPKLTVSGDGQFVGNVFQDQPFVYKGNKIEIISPYIDKDNLYKGQIHFHSDESDGNDTPTAIVTAYKTAGYDFVALTDHNVVTADPSVSDILFIPGVEETASIGHILRINTSGTIGPDEPQVTIDAAIADGAFVVMAHPNSVTYEWTDIELESLTGYYAVEVYNSISSGSLAADKWDTLLSRFEKVYGISVDDSHNLSNSTFATGAIQVYADALSIAEIMENLKRGNFYSTYTPQDSTDIELTIVVDKRNITATISIADTIKFITNGGTVSQLEFGTTSTYEIVGDEIYVRVEVCSDSVGVAEAELAWSNPIYINQSSRSDFSRGGIVQGNFYIRDKLGIGTGDPQRRLHIRKNSSGGAFSSGAALIIEDDGNTGINISTPDDALGFLYFTDDDDNVGGFKYNHATNDLTIRTNNADQVTIDDAGNVGIGFNNPLSTLSIDGGLHVGGNSDAGNNNLLVDGKLSAATYGSDGSVSDVELLRINSISSFGSDLIDDANAGDGRTTLGGTTIGQAIFTSTNPGAVTFGRANADNTFTWLSDANFRTAIGLGSASNVPIDNTAYDAGTWNGNSDGATKDAIRDKFEDIGSSYGEMENHGSANTLTIGITSLDYGVGGEFSAGDLNGFTFVAGQEDDASAVVRDQIVNGAGLGAGADSLTIWQDAHGLSTGDFIAVQSVNHDGIVEVVKIDNDSIHVEIAYVGDEVVTWQEGDYLEADAGTAGKYFNTMDFSTSAGAAAKEYHFKGVQNTTILGVSFVITTSGTTHQSGHDNAIITVVAGDRFWCVVENETDAENLLYEDSHMVLFKL